MPQCRLSVSGATLCLTPDEKAGGFESLRRALSFSLRVVSRDIGRHDVKKIRDFRRCPVLAEVPKSLILIMAYEIALMEVESP